MELRGRRLPHWRWEAAVEVAEMFSDRRKSPRHPRLVQVLIRVGDTQGRATTVDLSATGAFVATRASARIDDEVTLLVRSPGSTAYTIALVGRVTRVVAPGAGPQPGLGLAFVTARCPQGREGLVNFLQHDLGLVVAPHEEVDPYRFIRVLAVGADSSSIAAPLPNGRSRRSSPGTHRAHAQGLLHGRPQAVPPSEAGLSTRARPASGAYGSVPHHDAQSVPGPAKRAGLRPPSGASRVVPAPQAVAPLGGAAGRRQSAPFRPIAAARPEPAAIAPPRSSPRPSPPRTQARPPTPAVRQRAVSPSVSVPPQRPISPPDRRISRTSSRPISSLSTVPAIDHQVRAPATVEPPSPSEDDSSAPLLTRLLNSTSRFFGGVDKLVRGGDATSADGRFYAPGTGEVPEAGDVEAIQRSTGGDHKIVMRELTPVPIHAVPFLHDGLREVHELVTLDIDEQFCAAEVRYLDIDTLIIVGVGRPPKPNDAMWLHLALRVDGAWLTTYILGGLRHPAVPVTDGWCAEFMISSVRTPEETQRFRHFALATSA